ncbi:hypothetical protein NQ152_03615 [Microbacterium sp. zg.B48]|uniref:hypothetical protein n=1 Tax=unclassified Microbacterium TaxID=2609290 RepID=UPI00214AD070|nr:MULTISPECIES: hypothetical protein [unclassified Microbacterium]MCR2762592.1 hypothetical protein [Microbacterium sp. zg.B48]MCR2810762.1 hypothetical protein [Microbacterium sp. zg.B185]WIM18296.1 hypothetical protein QNO12_11860 [Microbacterium sp. zg-B185]
MDKAIDAVIEIFTWVGLGAGVLLAVIALVVHLVDGTWVPVRAVVEATEHGTVVRWFGEDGGVNEAPLTSEQIHAVGGAGMYDIFVRRGWQNRMRFTHGSPLVRALTLLAGGFLALGVAGLIASSVLLFARG